MKNKLTLLVPVSSLVLGLAASALANVTIRGSDTMLIMNQQLAEAFGAKNPSVPVNVTGGGSSIGINAFINGVANIAAASRPMRFSEIQRARSRGSIATEIPVALDGLAIIVNKDNPIKSVTMDQLRKIYVGQITNWSALGGSNSPITVFSRDSNSGTYGFFQANVLKNQNWGKGVRFMPSTADELREVGRSVNGIAYGGVAYFKNDTRVRIVPVAASATATALMPTEANVRAKKYPIWRYLYYYTNGKPSGETKRFIDFALSPAGQAEIEKVGYYALK